MRLRLCHCWPLAAALLGGCMSVEIETTADRGGGGERRYRIEVDPGLAKMYDADNPGEKLFKLPGDELDGAPGVETLARTQARDSGGGLAAERRYRAARLGDASTRGDSIEYLVSRAGLWVRYRYQEHYRAAGRDSGGTAAGYGGHRFRHLLRLPGRIVDHDADSIIDGRAVWSRPMSEVRAAGLRMRAESRELNPLLWLVAVAAAATGGAIAVLWGRRPGSAIPGREGRG